MKKFLPVLTILLLSLSCSQIDDTVDGSGTLQIKPQVDTDVFLIETRGTPTSDFSTYTLNLTGPSGMTVSFPTDGKVEGLATGAYTVTLSSHPAMPAPAFDTQYYTGSANATVGTGAPTPVNLTLTQANAGIYFVYDSSLSAAGLDIVPTVSSDKGNLVFSGTNKEQKGYFHPGDVTITLAEGGVPVQIGGAASQTIPLDPRDLCEVTLHYGILERTGTLAIQATVEVVNNPTKQTLINVGHANFYSHGEVIVAQEATAGSTPVHLVVIGDGFIEEDYLEGGAFDRIANEAIEGFFMVEPYPTYRDYFQVTKIAAYSNQRGATINAAFQWYPYNPRQQRDTFFSTVMAGGYSTGISCNYDKVEAFVKQYHPQVSSQNINNSTILLVINEEAYAGTCAIYHAGLSISMCPVDTDFKELVAHECSGHGFGRLLDEYIYTEGSYPASRRNSIISVRNDYGANITHGDREWSYAANVTFSTDPEAVHWKHYFTKPGYEEVGFYAGSHEYSTGIWRPEQNSCMNDNVAYFNAPSREAIVRRLTKIAGEPFSYDTFYANEKQITYPFAASPARAYGTATRPPLGPPVLIER